MDDHKPVDWVAEVFPDWTTLQVGPGRCFAFNRETGRVYKVPHPDCPFVLNPFVQNEPSVDGGSTA